MDIDVHDLIPEVNALTIEESEELWKKNFHQNREIMRATLDPERKGLKGLPRGVVGPDVWMFSAGGSVDEGAIKRFKKLNRGEPVWAADAVYRNLLMHGIVPDVVFALDGAARTYEYFRGVDHDPKTVLVASVFANPDMVDEFRNRVYFYHVVDPARPIYKEFQDRWKHSIGFRAVGNVGNIMFLTGRVLGVKRYWCVGFDYCYLNRRPYCANVWCVGKPKKVDRVKLIRHAKTGLYSTRSLTVYYQALLDVWKQEPGKPSIGDIYNVTGKGFLGLGDNPNIHRSSWSEYRRLTGPLPMEPGVREFRSRVA